MSSAAVHSHPLDWLYEEQIIGRSDAAWAGALSTALAGCCLLYRRQRRLLARIAQLDLAGEELSHRAFHDPLTGLPNRSLFMNRLERALMRSARHRRPVAVLYLDLDHFKRVNDTFGHRVGDRLLTGVGERLQGSIRPGDTTCRLGGDEFAILLEEVRDVEGAVVVVKRVRGRLRQAFEVGQEAVTVTASIGIALSESEEVDPDELLSRADAAMYRAKVGGRDRYEVDCPSDSYTRLASGE
jgi:diguanylate cyclase (GGDEF)-like protein